MKHVFILIFLHIITCHVCICKQYRISLVKIEDCKDPELPFARLLPFKLVLEVFNSTKGYKLIRGNLTVPKDISAQDKSASFSYGTVTAAGIKWKYTIKNLRCSDFLIKANIGKLGIPFKGCVMKKGEYSFKDIDIDAIDSVILGAPARVYGMFVSKTMIDSKNETLVCWVCHLKVTPLANKTRKNTWTKGTRMK